MGQNEKMLVKSMEAVAIQNIMDNVPVTTPVRLSVIKIAARSSLTILSMLPTLRFMIEILSLSQVNLLISERENEV